MSATDWAINDIRYPPEHENGIRRVQVGCGPHHIRPDWWNTDIRAFPGIDEPLNATTPWRWNGLLDYVYAEHFIEHLQIDEAVAFLTEAGRALRLGGKIRLSTPCLEWVLRSHFSFATAETGRHFDETLDINRAFHGWGHKFLYSEGALRRLLTEVGYENVRFCGYGQSETPALRALELHEGSTVAHPFPTQWIIEGERGDTAIAAPPMLLAELEAKLLAHVRPGH